MFSSGNKMAATTALELLVGVIVIPSIIFLSCEGFPTCFDFPYEEPTDCKYGIVTDWCHRHVCAKGPEERCGGWWNLLGKCGAGTYCSCGKCTGCSTYTLECFFGDFC